MHSALLSGAAIVMLPLLAGCAVNPTVPTRAVYYAAPAWPPRPSPPTLDDLSVDVDPPRYAPETAQPSIERVAASPDPDPAPVIAPRPGVPAGSDCGWHRLCNLPGWRYEN